MKHTRHHILSFETVLLGLALATTVASQLRAESPRRGVQYGLDRILTKAAPGLSERVRPTAPDKGIDTKAGYPYYAGPRIVPDALAAAQTAPASNSGNRNLFQASMPTGRNFAPPPAPPRAIAQAPVNPAPVAPAASGISGLRAPTYMTADLAKGATASSLQQEIDAVENQMQAREAAAAGLKPQQAAIAQAMPTSTAPAGGRLLAGLKSEERAPQNQIDTFRQELAVAEFAAERPALRGDNSPMYVSAAANGELDSASQVNRQLRGAVPTTTRKSAIPGNGAKPVSVETQHNPYRSVETDAPGGVWHLRR